MGWMQTTCREAARLMSARRDVPLGAWQGLALKLHLRLCGDCREIERQFERVARLGADRPAGAPEDGSDGSSPPQR